MNDIYEDNHPFQNHPERKQNEIFLTNADRTTITRVRMKYESARVGMVAYTIDGEIIEAFQGLSPVFVDRKEFQEKRYQT